MTKEDANNSPTSKALMLGGEIKQIVVGTPLEKDAMILGAMYTSGYFKDLTSLSKAITKALIGQQMGMGLVQSMNSLYVIDGKVAMDSHAIRNIAANGGFVIKTIEMSKDKCVIEWSKDGEVLGTSEFTWEDATAAGLTNKSNWKTYPKDMLFARAVTRGARMYASQAFANNPIYERDEISEAGIVDISPTDERAEAIRNAKDIDELKELVAGFNTEEKKSLSHLVTDKIKELTDGTDEPVTED